MTPAPRLRRVLGLVALSAIAALASGATASLHVARPPVAARAVAPASPLVDAVGCVGLTVSDLDRSVAFYTRALDFRAEPERELSGAPWEALTGVFALRARVARLHLGAECLELTQFLGPVGRPAPVDARSNDRWFQHAAIVVSDMNAAYARLRAARVEHASSGPQRLPDWNPSAGGIEAFYFKDPDRHVLELIRFPPGKGDARWAARDGRLFLGIDHTAIVVGDTAVSLAIYRDLLGLRVAGGSENWGTEQEHLNGVRGARLRITTLRAARGPGVELLEYLSPRDGRPYPAEARPNDLVHWHTTLFTHDVEAAARAMRAVGSATASPGPVELPERDLGVARALLARDPDGHALQLAEAVNLDPRTRGEAR